LPRGNRAIVPVEKDDGDDPPLSATLAPDKICWRLCRQ
jgi:hypothetical protein